MFPRRTHLFALIVTIPLVGAFAEARAQITREEAMARIYPGAEFVPERVFLTDAEQRRARELAGVDVPSKLVARYIARRNDEVVGVAYVDTHVVRTKNESLLIGLNPDRTVRRVEVTAFLEPAEYMATDIWYGQYEGRSLTEDLNLQRAIRPIAGATLTGTATNEAVRRVLAIDEALSESEP
jgi:hypothetical protein